MRLEQDHLGERSVLSPVTECSLGKLQTPEIVGEVRNPALEAVCRLWWRAFDRVCYYGAHIRMLIHDQIYGPEPPTPADLKRETDHAGLIRAFPNGMK